MCKIKEEAIGILSRTDCYPRQEIAQRAPVHAVEFRNGLTTKKGNLEQAKDLLSSYVCMHLCCQCSDDA